MKRFLTDVKQGRVPQTYWHYDEAGHTQDAKKEIVSLFGGDVFGTPKPEKLMQRVLEIGSAPGVDKNVVVMVYFYKNLLEPKSAK